MSFRTGTTADRSGGTGGRFTRPLLLSVCATLLLAALLGTYQFGTRDALGVPRSRSAAHVWRAADQALARIDAGIPVHGLFIAALAATVAGCFLLVWLAPGPTSRRPERDVVPSPPRPGIEGVTLLNAYRQVRGIVSDATVVVPGARTCVFLCAALSLLVVWRLGGFAIDAAGTGLPDGFASVDHPFHVSRAELLRRSLASGEILRWVGAHQGGYPVEFYPLGFAYGVLALWALLLGLVPLAAVHKLAVIGLFLAPAGVFWWMSRRDGWPPLVALTAFTFHVTAPGGFWHGGYSELLYMGLAPNVAAAIAVAACITPMVNASSSGRHASIAWAALAAAAAVWCNPRSAVGLVSCGTAVWIVVVSSQPGVRTALLAAGRLAAVALLAGLLAAPELVSLVRFSELYYFIHYTSYANTADYLAAVIEAVSLPVFPLVLCGLAVATMLPRDRIVTRATALAAALYVGVTVTLTFGGLTAAQQLETTRLMPLQRLLMIYLAAVGLHAAALVIAQRAERRWARYDVISIGVAVALLAAWLTPSALVPPHVSAPARLDRSGSALMQGFERAVRAAANAAPEGTSILIVGSGLSAHQQLWAPMVADRTFFYDDWMWYWHQRHAGPYDPRTAAKYDQTRIDEVFSREFLTTHGVGAVVVTGKADAMAQRMPWLAAIAHGRYTPYLVKEPASVVTIGERPPDSLAFSNHRITATSADASGPMIVRQNWFPRWRAEVNGTQVPVEQTAEGYMRVRLPAGAASISLVYGLDRVDLAARGAALLALGVIAYAVAGRLLHRAQSARNRATGTVSNA